MNPKKKNTGLGETSLLLQRTTPAEPVDVADTEIDDPIDADVQASERRDVRDVSDALELTISDGEAVAEPEPTARPASRPPKKKLHPIRDKCTIYLDQDVNELLGRAARAQNRERSEIVTEILRSNLPTYRIRITRTKANSDAES